MAWESCITSILLFYFQQPNSFPPSFSIPALCATTLTLTVRPVRVLRSLKVCAALLRHALTCVLPCPAVPHAHICFLLCCKVAPLPSVDPLQFGDVPLRLPWEPTLFLLHPGIPQKPSFSLSLSICLCPSLTHFLPLLFSFRCLTLLLFLIYTVFALSITVTDLRVWHLQNVKAMQPLAHMSKNRDTRRASKHTGKYWKTRH